MEKQMELRWKQKLKERWEKQQKKWSNKKWNNTGDNNRTMK